MTCDVSCELHRLSLTHHLTTLTVVFTFRSMGAGLMSLTAVKNLLKNMTDSHGLAFSQPDSVAKMQELSL